MNTMISTSYHRLNLDMIRYNSEDTHAHQNPRILQTENKAKDKKILLIQQWGRSVAATITAGSDKRKSSIYK